MTNQPPKRLATRTVTNPAPGVPVVRPSPKPKRVRRPEACAYGQCEVLRDGSAYVLSFYRVIKSPDGARRYAKYLLRAAAWIEQEQRKGAKR